MLYYLIVCRSLTYAQRTAAALERAGVDLFLVESVMAMAEARAAVLGIRKAGGDKPVLVTCYCDDEGRTPTGTDVPGMAAIRRWSCDLSGQRGHHPTEAALCGSRHRTRH